MRKALTILTALVAIFTLTTMTATAVAPRHDGKDCSKKHAFDVDEYGGAQGGDTQAIKLTVKIKQIDHGVGTQPTEVYTVTGKTTSKKYIFCRARLYDRKGLDPFRVVKKIKLSSNKRSFKAGYTRVGQPPMSTRAWARIK